MYCEMYVDCMWIVCGIRNICEMYMESGMYVEYNMWNACEIYAECIWNVCGTLTILLFFNSTHDKLYCVP